MSPAVRAVQVSWGEALLLTGTQSCLPGNMEHLMSPGHLGLQTMGQVPFHQFSQRPYLEDTNATQLYR